MKRLTLLEISWSKCQAENDASIIMDDTKFRYNKGKKNIKYPGMHVFPNIKRCAKQGADIPHTTNINR